MVIEDLKAKYLSPDHEFLLVDEFCLLQSKERSTIYGYAKEKDPRIARIQCLWSAIETSENLKTRLKAELDQPDLASRGLACGATLAGAEERVLKKSVRQWVLHQWLVEKRVLHVDIESQKRLKGLGLEAGRAFHQLVSYFEPKTGIHHHHFIALASAVGDRFFFAAGVARDKSEAFNLAIVEFEFRRRWTFGPRWMGYEREQKVVDATSRRRDFFENLPMSETQMDWPGLRVDFMVRKFFEEESLAVCWAWPFGAKEWYDPIEENIWML